MKLLYVFTLSMIPLSFESAYAMNGDTQPTSTNHPTAIQSGTQKKVYNDVEDWLKENVPVVHPKHKIKHIKKIRSAYNNACLY